MSRSENVKEGTIKRGKHKGERRIRVNEEENFEIWKFWSSESKEKRKNLALNGDSETNGKYYKKYLG